MTFSSKKVRAISHSFRTEERKEFKRIRRQAIANKQRFAAWA